MDQSEIDELEQYLDGLIQNKVIDNPSHDNYKVNQNFYDQAIKRHKDVKTRNPHMTPFEVFNMCMLLELMVILNLTNPNEIDRYAQVLIRCFIASGIYEKLFPGVWKEEVYR